MTVLTWLHLSDMHFCDPETGWESRRVFEELLQDLRNLENKEKLRPDLIFFTGDLAFGNKGDKEGMSLGAQFAGADERLDEIRRAFSIEVPKENVFLTPGNHDIDFKKVSKQVVAWLKAQKNDTEIVETIRDGGIDWENCMRPLEDYRKFLEESGYAHLVKQDSDRLIYGLVREIDGVKVGVGAFNSVWAWVDKSEEQKGKLWMAADWQCQTIAGKMKGADFGIGLAHVPPNWLVEGEELYLKMLIAQNFRFYLHGHEHRSWVSTEDSRLTTLSAGAFYQSKKRAIGYSMVRLDFAKAEGQVFLRSYDFHGGGWVPRIIKHKSEDPPGVAKLTGLPWMEDLSKKLSGRGPGRTDPDGGGGGAKTGETSPKDKTGVATRPADAAALLKSYLSRVFHDTGTLHLSGIDPKAVCNPQDRGSEQEACLRLGAVYTALMTRGVEKEEKASEQVLMERGGQRGVSALSMLDRNHRLVLLGDPGSGKSTFVNFVAWCLAGEALENEGAGLKDLVRPLPDEDGKDRDEPQPWGHGALLPVRVVLRDLAASGLFAEDGNGENLLWRFVEKELENIGHREFAPVLKEELRKKGRCILLLDGLDEVPQADRMRERIKKAIEDFSADFPDCKLLVTSRTYAYQKQNWGLSGLSEAILAPFSAGQIRRFVDLWYRHIGALRGLDGENVEGRAQLLKRAIFGNDRILELAGRPLLLTLMASLHAWRGGSLPEKREQLYDDTVELLLDWWQSRKNYVDAGGQCVLTEPGLAEWLDTDREEVKKVLNELAFDAHGRQPELTGTADIPQKELAEKLLAASDNMDLNVGKLVDFLRDRAGILVPHGVKVYTFPHRTFQEYLAARHLTDNEFPEKVADLARQDPDRWREVALLAGAKAARGGAGQIWSLAEHLCFKKPDDSGLDREDFWGALLAGQALAETADLKRVSGVNDKKLKRVVAWLVKLLACRELPAVERAAAGVALATLGDPREEITTLERMAFCHVPGGNFMMGEKGDKDAELHENDCLKTGYWIGKYPVTQRQFSFFAKDGGYEKERYWAEARRHGWWGEKGLKTYRDSAPRKKAYSAGPPFDLSNHPAVYITWYEAMAFGRWLTEKWVAAGVIPDNWIVTLPSEAQWEKAARGGIFLPERETVSPADEMVMRHGPLEKDLKLPEKNEIPVRAYPWGDDIGPELANIKESKVGSTCTPGCFTLGKSPYGCLDMLGNCCEWTRSIKEDYPYVPADGREKLAEVGEYSWMVIKGASFYSGVSSQWLRCGARYNYDPYSHVDYFGFRMSAAPFTSGL